jgi:hypothetical protein
MVFTLRACLWGAGCYNMRDAVQLTDTSPCLRNVLPSVKARTLDLLSMCDLECKYSGFLLQFRYYYEVQVYTHWQWWQCDRAQ